MKTGTLVLAIVVLLVMVFSFAKKKGTLILNFCLRVVFGFLAIYGVNYGLYTLDIVGGVGFNPISAVTLGTLGMPGFFLLYAISLTKFL